MFWLWLIAFILACWMAIKKTYDFFKRCEEKGHEMAWVGMVYLFMGIPLLGFIPFVLWLLKP